MYTFYRDNLPFVSMQVINVPQYHCSICGVFFVSSEPLLQGSWDDDDPIIRSHYNEVHKEE